MKFPLLFFFLILLGSCSSSKKAAITDDEDKSLPELPASEIDIPIKIAAAGILARAEALVPAEFTSDAWPEFMQPSCDFRYKYRFTRTALQIGALNNVISVRFGGNYQVSGSKCLCTGGIPVTPWISGNCGFAPQPMRKVQMALSASLQFLPNYTLITNTSIVQIKPIDKCAVSVFSKDITQLIMDSIRSSLALFSAAMDKTVAGINFGNITTKFKDSAFRKISVGRNGYFLLNPSALRIGQLNYIKDSFSISVGLSCKPVITSDPVNHIPVPARLPSLLQTENRSGLKIFLNVLYDYESLSRILRDSLKNKVFEINGRTLVIKNASVRGIGHHQIEFQVDFSGSNHGSIFLRGTPVLDSIKQTLWIPDIQYSMEGEDLALKIAKSLFRNKIKKTIQGKSYLDISAILIAIKSTIDQQLNREWLQNVYSAVSLKQAVITRMLITKQVVQLQLFISGELKVNAGNL